MTLLAERIGWDPDVCNGKPVVAGTRITVQSVVEYLSAGDSPEDVIRFFPELQPADINACLKFAARLLDRHWLPLPAAA
ncbi:MAG: DUF433 domain-containing protein [Proteobacteria bacterium]|jgi:uncharacterized protein (DUF433 family)|nr:DUF433 domain-containing protein [Pseudomonadota bacterium]